MNLARKDGLTALDLLNLRPNQEPVDNSTQQGYVIDRKAQVGLRNLVQFYLNMYMIVQYDKIRFEWAEIIYDMSKARHL